MEYTVLCLCLLFSAIESKASNIVRAARGSGVILNCPLNGTFKFPEWHGPPAGKIYAKQDDPKFNPDIPSYQEHRLNWSNYVDLTISQLTDQDAGNYSCIYGGLGVHTFELVVTDIDLPKVGGSDSSLAVIVVPIWLFLCTIALLIVSKNTEVFHYSVYYNSGLIVTCYFVIGWFYIVYELYQIWMTAIDGSKNVRRDVEVQFVNNGGKQVLQSGSSKHILKETPVSRYIQDFSLDVVQRKGQLLIYSLKRMANRTEHIIEQAKIKKYELGPHLHRCDTDKTIMLVAAESTGKRTFIDGIVNYVMGVHYEDQHRLTLFKDEDIKTKASDEEDWTTCYTINPEEDSRVDYALHIVNIPGYKTGERGKLQIMDQIKKCLSIDENNEGINALCFLLKATDTDLKYEARMFSSIAGLLKKGVKILYLIMFADGPDTQVGNALTKVKVPNGVGFIFSNSRLFTEKANGENLLDAGIWRENEECFRKFFLEIKSTAILPYH